MQPRLWPQIEFVSSGGQESRSLIIQQQPFTFSYCSWGSQGKNAEVVCHSLLQ